MNFISEYKKGQYGENKGLTMGDGLKNLDAAIGGIHKGRIITVASSPKCGKTTLVDYACVIEPYLYMLENKCNIDWIYYSFEIDRVSKEFDFCTFFLNKDYNITHVKLEDGVVNVFGKEQSTIPLSPQYLRGMLRYTDGRPVLCKKNIEEAMMETYRKRIIPIFGEWDDKNNCIKKGAIYFFTSRMSPTLMREHIINYAQENGNVSFTDSKHTRITGYVPKKDKYTIIIIDHMRKLIQEQNQTLKQTVDKMTDYMVEIRNNMNFTFIPIIHTNRSIADSDNIKMMKDTLYPGPESIKDTGNLSEDSDYVITMFNPNDDRYNLQSHFGITLKDDAGNLIYPNLRTIHLVESRHTVYPQHFKVNMIGNLKKFEQL